MKLNQKTLSVILLLLQKICKAVRLGENAALIQNITSKSPLLLNGNLSMIEITPLIYFSENNTDIFTLEGNITISQSSQPALANQQEESTDFQNFENFSPRNEKIQRSRKRVRELESSIDLKNLDQKQIFNFEWTFEPTSETSYYFGPNLKLIKAERFGSLSETAFRFYNLTDSTCFFTSKVNTPSYKFKISEEECRRLVNVAFFGSTNSLEGQKFTFLSFFSGFIKADNQFQVTALNSQIQSSTFTFSLPNFQPNNKQFDQISHVLDQPNAPNRSPTTLVALYNSGYPEGGGGFIGLERFLVIKNCSDDQIHNGYSSLIQIPTNEDNSTIENFDCLFSIKMPKNKPYGDILSYSYYVYCFGLFSLPGSSLNHSLEKNAQRKVIKIMGADLRSTKGTFQEIYISNSSGFIQGLQYLGISRHFISVTGNPFTSIGLNLYFIYQNKIKLCPISEILRKNRSEIKLEGFLKNCLDYEDVTLGLHPETEFISQFTVFPFHGLVPVVGFSLEIKNKDLKNDTVRRYSKGLLKNMKFPEIQQDEIWVNWGDLNTFISYSSPYVRKRFNNAVFKPYFAFKRPSEHQRSIKKPSQNSAKKSKQEVQRVLIKVMDKISSSNFSLNFIEVDPKSVNSTFELSAPSKRKFTLTQWKSERTTVFFSRPVKCSGFSILDIDHNYKEDVEIKLLPFKILYQGRFGGALYQYRNNQSRHSYENYKYSKISLKREKYGAVQPSIQTQLDVEFRTKKGRKMEQSYQEPIIFNENFYVLNTNRDQVSSISNLFYSLTYSFNLERKYYLRKANSNSNSHLLKQIRETQEGEDAKGDSFERVAIYMNTRSSSIIDPSTPSNLYTVKNLDSGIEAYSDSTDWHLALDNDQILGIEYSPENLDIRFIMRLMPDFCFFYVKTKRNNFNETSKNVDLNLSEKGGLATGSSSKLLKGVNITAVDSRNQTISFDLDIEINNLQSVQEIKIRKDKLSIDYLQNFSKFNFYDYFNVTGFWFDLDNSLSEDSKLQAQPDETMMIFTNIFFAKSVYRQKYSKADSNYTLFKALFTNVSRVTPNYDLITLVNNTVVGYTQNSQYFLGIQFGPISIGQYGNIIAGSNFYDPSTQIVGTTVNDSIGFAVNISSLEMETDQLLGVENIYIRPR